MIDCGITQTELAKKIGYAQRTISSWINNQSEPTETAIKKCALALEVSTDFLLGLDDIGVRTVTPMSDAEYYSEEEKKLVEDYRALNYAGKKLVKQTVETLRATSAQSEQKKNKIS